MTQYRVTVGKETFTVELLERRGATISFSIEGHTYQTTVSPILREAASKSGSARSHPVGSGEVRAPIPGIVSDLRVSEGDVVTVGTTLLVLEAMKMENPIKASRDGTVTRVLVSKGQEIPSGTTLLIID